MGTVHRLAKSRENDQTHRYRWIESPFGYWVKDANKPERAVLYMGDGHGMFADENGENGFVPGTQLFYDALNMYFDCEQASIGLEWFNDHPLAEVMNG